MPEVVTGQITEDGDWIAATLNDRRQLQDIRYGHTEQVARERCLEAHSVRIDREQAELRSQPGWVPGSGGQV
jgi:hypothetical protein